MISFSSRLLRFALVSLLLLRLASTGSAQITLKEALDFDGDGLADFSVFRPTDAVWYIARTDGQYQFQPWGVANDDTPTPGDYDGDNRADVSIWRDSTGAFYWINSSNFTVTGVGWGQSGDEAVARDYDGDGKTDPAVVRRSGGYMFWYVLGSQDGFFSVSWGADTDYTAPGDYDGDFKFDFAVQREGATAQDSAVFYLLQSRDGIRAEYWGFGSDFVAPGDYDGDGRTDVAVVRDGPTLGSGMEWYAKRSSDGSVLGASFGATGDDVIVQGYYDNDNRTDIAVWRSSTGTYYVLRSTDFGVTAFPWGLPTDQPIAAYDTH